MEKRSVPFLALAPVFLTLGGWLATAGPGATSAWAEPGGEAERIVHRLAEQDKRLALRRRQFDYDLLIIRQRLDADRRIVSESKERVVVYADRAPDYGSRPEKGPEGETAKAAKEEPFEVLNLIDHYFYAIDGSETVNGVDCYKIRFTPKPNMPYRNREEKVCNAVWGHLWVSKEDYSLMRNEGFLGHPVSVAWFFARLYELHFRWESQRLPNGDWGPKEVRYRYAVHIPFGWLRERVIRQYRDFRYHEGSRKPLAR
ncbi:conserved protein of unknown function [Methylacidimicrobium sp. AP8]|uniref:hypothetical protein n=1 Tax=Methylacidimicrobium sp. AP8 TaxID=2730359 RepID=UPI0018BFCBAC|nr:hypothetical protein [Methylacidimicrobium sp. AP8]CAB4243159.1 conserved protein of unknown function [Methylacidimicrobium sp. AP8]